MCKFFTSVLLYSAVPPVSTSHTHIHASPSPSRATHPVHSHPSSRCGLRRGFGGPLRRGHLRLAQRHPRQTRLPPLHHSDRHLQHPGGVPGGDGHDYQREPGGRVAAVTFCDVR